MLPFGVVLKLLLWEVLLLDSIHVHLEFESARIAICFI